MKKRNHNFVDMTGKIVNNLTVLNFAGINRRGAATWLCLCKCGKRTTVCGQDLRKGGIKSCGCFGRARTARDSFKHGHAVGGVTTAEYRAWHSMISRCCNPNAENFQNYGGRGIIVCNRWLESFNNFYADMGDRPSPSHSLDRIDNNKGYYKDNCRWATCGVQQLNKRISSNNTSGITGVCYAKDVSKFFAYIGVNKKIIRLGYFESFDAAVSSRKEAEEIYHKPILEKEKGVI